MKRRNFLLLAGGFIIAPRLTAEEGKSFLVAAEVRAFIGDMQRRHGFLPEEKKCSPA